MNPRTLLIACGALLGAPLAHGQNIIFVDDDASGADDGSDWTNAFRSLDDALASASPFDQVWVAQGSYQPKSNGDETSSFTIPDRVLVAGGFAGVEHDLSERTDPFATPAILEGDVTGGPGDIDHLVTISGISSCTLDGFVIANAYAQAGVANPDGAGILVEDSNPLLINLRVLNCFAQGNGGGLAVLGESYVNLIDSTFDSCTGANGGAVSTGWPTIIDGCTFEDNTATVRGGAIHVYGQGVSDVARCRFEDNHAGDGGGAIDSALQRVSTTTALYVRESDFVGNMTDNTGGDGGAILFRFDGQHQVLRCRFVGNYAHDDGGAIQTQIADAAQSLFVENALLTGNIALDRGAGINQQTVGELWVSNSTIMGNDSGGLGAGIFTNNGDLLVSNSIVWDNDNVNTAGQGLSDQIAFNGAPTRTIDINYCLVQSWNSIPAYASVATSGDDPDFTDATGTDGIYGTEDDSCSIDPGSPAIDAGNSLYVSPLGSTDIEGNTRFHDDTGTTDTGVSDGVNPIVDIGASEFQGTTPCFFDCDDNGTLNVDDIDCYVAAFLGGDLAHADCDGNGMLNVDDIDCYVAGFLAGCP